MGDAPPLLPWHGFKEELGPWWRRPRCDSETDPAAPRFHGGAFDDADRAGGLRTLPPKPSAAQSEKPKLPSGPSS